MKLNHDQIKQREIKNGAHICKDCDCPCFCVEGKKDCTCDCGRDNIDDPSDSEYWEGK